MFWVTDKLVGLIKDAANTNTEFPSKAIDEIENYHINLCCQLHRNEQFRNYCTVLIQRYCNELRKIADGVRLLKECSSRSLDRAASFGELLSTTIFHFLCLENSLKPILIDARKVIKTDSNFTSAKVLMKPTKRNAIKIIGLNWELSCRKKIIKRH
jgi:aspartokinase/homoserine dehydrogenase 1